MTTFTGPTGVTTFQAVSIKNGLKFYVRNGMKPNSAWTPTAMLYTATRITGNKYKRSQHGYQQAIADLDHWLEINGITGV